MIADDMMTFIKSDIVIFGLGVFIFIIVTLWYVFRKLVWIVVPISSCLIISNSYDWSPWNSWVESYSYIIKLYCTNVNINNGNEYSYEYSISSIKKNNPSLKKSELILMTSQKMFWPIIYTVLTTICAFLSLIFSEIKPIIDFGWMMTIGLIIIFYSNIYFASNFIKFFRR